MGTAIEVVAAAAGGYLLGSVSFALLLARLRGVNLRAVGSGNLGATNAGRALGLYGGIAVLVLDVLKGALPAWLAGHFPDVSVLRGVAAGAGAVAGHVWPLDYRFRGGKGVATLCGAMAALAPWALLVSVGSLAAAVLATRYVSIGSLVLAVALPATVWALEPAEAFTTRLPVFVFALAAGGLIVYTHRSNISRLLAGRENRLGGPRPKHG